MTKSNQKRTDFAASAKSKGKKIGKWGKATITIANHLSSVKNRQIIHVDTLREQRRQMESHVRTITSTKLKR